MGESRKRIRSLTAAALALGVSGCGRTFLPSGGNMSPAGWNKFVASKGLNPDEVPNPVAVTDELKKAAASFAGAGTDREKLSRIQKALFDDRNFTFTYDAGSTYGASEAYSKRRGNCVAFTNLFIALGRSLRIPLQAGFLKRSTSERDGNLILVSSHLVAVYKHVAGVTVFDFYRSREGPTENVLTIDDSWLVAIYLSNLGVEALRCGEPAAAARDFEAAVKLAPDFEPSWGNLGVARRRLRDDAGALEAYRHALELAPHDPNVLTNLASLYEANGKSREASAALAAADLSEASSYTLVVRGDLELAGGKVDRAVSLYRKAHRMSPADPIPLLSMARAEQARGRAAAAREALAKVLKIVPENTEAKKLLEGL